MKKVLVLIASVFVFCTGGAGQSNSDLSAVERSAGTQKRDLAAAGVDLTMFRNSAISKLPLPPPT